MTLLVCSLLALGLAAWVILPPLVRLPETPYFTGKNEGHHFDPKVALLESIAELREDLTSGHLTPEEFDQLSLEAQRAYLTAKKGDPAP